MRDLINDDVEEEESEDEIGRGAKRAHDEDELDQDLEDDDYDLIEENLGRKIERKKKFRRVRRLEDDDDEEEEEQARDAKDAIASELFNDEDEDEEHERPIQRDRSDREAIDNRFAEIEESEESDEDNFIVDDNDQPIVNRQRTKKSERFTDQALQQAQEIFGVDFDYDEINNYDENGDFDEEEEYGEGEEISERAVKKKKKRSTKKSIFELYEPAELERSHLTEFDNEIRNTDLPERFQLRAVPVTNCSAEEIKEEANWIYRELYSTPKLTCQSSNDSSLKEPLAGYKQSSVVGNIQQVLNYIRNEFCEVPYIAHYRKEYYQPGLSVDDLWYVYQWDEKWCQLQERKRNIIKLLENMREFQVAIIAASEDQTLPHYMRRVTERDVRRANSIQSMDEFNDCYLHFKLHYSAHVNDMKKYILQQKREERARKRLEARERRNLDGEPIDEEGDENDDDQDDEEELSERMGFMKLAVRRDMYTICKEYGIDMFAAKFGLTPEQFGEHLAEGYARNDIEQLDMEPLDAAQEYTTKRFSTPDKVLKGAILIVGRQISCDPVVRKTVRQVFYERARVNVHPTKKGMKEIDEGHPCYTIKYLRNKLISTFEAEQFLQLTLAKTEGLLEMQITIDDVGSGQNLTYFDEIKHLYQRVGHN